MRMFSRGEWVEASGGKRFEVRSPFDGAVLDSTPLAEAADVDAALRGAVEGARLARAAPAWRRAEWLRQAARRVLARQEELARGISLEEGKTLREARVEVERGASTLEISAEEAKRLGGESLPMDSTPVGEGKLGFTVRAPCGVVAAITPFNFPLNLVCHKVGPALAGGNAVVVKPASDTPLTALRLVEILLEAGVPPLAITCLTGPGGAVGDALCADPRARKISFTGSAEVGRRICHVAGLKRVTMELGANCPLIVLPDADLAQVARAAAATGFTNAGQTCVSTQRVIAHERVYSDLLEALRPEVERVRAGDPLADATGMGPMVRERDAARVEAWIAEAAAGGARVLCGGERRGALLAPTLLADVKPEMRVSREELFGPAVAVLRAASLDEALALANDSRFGLSAGVFTRDVGAALRCVREIESGNIHINWAPTWRADFMPYGGLKDSGLGKEGPKYAILEMTEEKTVIWHG